MELIAKALLSGVGSGLCWAFLFSAPLLILFGAACLEFRRERCAPSPQEARLLRPPGWSLSLKLDESVESMAWNALSAGASFALFWGVAEVLGKLVGWNASVSWVGSFAVFEAFFAAGVLHLTLRAHRIFLEVRRLRLGLRGEQAVAEALNEVAPFGFRAFHDLQPDGAWNIDHILVGPRGVFVIETKARRKYPSRTASKPHELHYDGQTLNFPNGRQESAPIRQAERNAAWVADYIAKKTKEVTPVHAIVVLPGWYTHCKGNYRVKVMNTTFLKKHLARATSSIEPVQAARIAEALDEKCRTIEF